jgi:GNAT superfamily N-acetyltransferase
MEYVFGEGGEGSTVRAMEENMWQSFLTLGRAKYVDIHDSPELLRIITGIPHPIMNGIFRTALSDLAAENDIEEAFQPFVKWKIPMVWWIGPSTEPADLGSRLTAMGLVHQDDSPGMAADLSTIDFSAVPSPRGLAIMEVLTDSQLEEFIDLFITIFQLPDAVGRAFLGIYHGMGFSPANPWRNFIACMEQRPVAISSLSLSAGVAGLWNIATLPGYRKQGIGRALTAATLREARSLGYRGGILISSASGMGLYQNLGFAQCCTFSQYIFSPPPP